VSWIPRPLRVLGFRLGAGSERWPVEPADLWIHGASLGEVAAAGSLMQRFDGGGPRVHLTSGTPEGLTRAEDRQIGHGRSAGPLDRRSTRRLLRRLRPGALWLVESEFWPGLLAAAADAGVPVGVVGARLSERSFRRYDSRPGRRWFRTLGARIERIAAADADSAERLVRLGIPEPRIRRCGRIKVPTSPPATSPVTDLLDRLAPGERRWTVGGCTHSGEEELLLRTDAWPVLLAPRHLERLADVEAVVRERGLRPVRRSGEPASLARDEVLVLDTVGELAAGYSRAAWTLVGGSVLGERAHDLLEPLAAGSRLLAGARLEHQEDDALQLRAAGALVTFDGGLPPRIEQPLVPAPLLAALDGRDATLDWMREGGLLPTSNG
jgi:3-deoxy-D-manno-octulosonic-acid transferase